ncbi:hypothetical protein C5B85_10535 [Pseudoclavibacter sp. AY1F1]|nr:hypothetical protein C5B85_10535 [Pseudoclavibacter sp. AY1F1]
MEVERLTNRSRKHAEPHHSEPEDFVGFVAAETAEFDLPAQRTSRTLWGRVTNVFRRIAASKGMMAQLINFGLVGGVGFIVDTGLFNVLMLTVLNPSEVAHGALWAKVISTCAAIVTNWIGNRIWTFRQHKRQDNFREAIEFFGVSLVGLGIGLLPIWFTNAVLDNHSFVAYNIANLVGIGLGAIFRFILYRFWVFSPKRVAEMQEKNNSDVTAR